MISKIEYLMALSHITALNPLLTKQLYDNFPNLVELFNAKSSTLEKLNLPSQIIDSLKNPPWKLVEESLNWATQPNHYLITINDAKYPNLIKKIAAPPLLLFVAGNIDLLNTPQLAIVGSRNPTPIGKETTFAFAKQLASNGFTITSGLAAGIDTKAHQGAVAACGGTIAVMGTGLDKIYPKSNTELAQRILEQDGTLVSEFFIGTPGLPRHFPLRNRIISGLSYGTLVVEATIRSGSLITARLALEQNREVFAIPGSIHNPLARGCHALIRQGAKLVETTADIFVELKHLVPLLHSPHINKETDVNNDSKQNTLDRNYKKLLECIGYEATSIDLIISRSNFNAKQVASMLLILELDGYVVNINGGYIRVK